MRVSIREPMRLFTRWRSNISSLLKVTLPVRRYKITSSRNTIGNGKTFALVTIPSLYKQFAMKSGGESSDWHGSLMHVKTESGLRSTLTALNNTLPLLIWMTLRLVFSFERTQNGNITCRPSKTVITLSQWQLFWSLISPQDHIERSVCRHQCDRQPSRYYPIHSMSSIPPTLTFVLQDAKRCVAIIGGERYVGDLVNRRSCVMVSSFTTILYPFNNIFRLRATTIITWSSMMPTRLYLWAR